MKEEQWLPVEGYVGFYEVSDMGRVRRIHSYRKRKVGLIKPCACPRGYLYVTLSIPGKVRNALLHRLVGRAHVSNPEKLPQINHRDGVKGDCRATNLEWNTSSQNILHAYRVLNRSTVPRRGEKSNFVKLTEPKARQIKNASGKYSEIAAAFGVTPSCVGLIKRGKRWRHVHG